MSNYALLHIIQSYSILFVSLSTLAIIISLISSIFGIGGGFLMVPAINFMVSMYFPNVTSSMSVAVTTSLFSILCTHSIVVFKRRSSIQSNIHIIRCIIPSAIIGGTLGSYLIKFIHDDVLHSIFALFLIVIIIGKRAIIYILKQYPNIPRKYYFIVLIPLCILCSLCGIGGGIIIFPIILYIYNDTSVAALVASINSLVLSLSHILLTFIYPHSVNILPFFIEDVFTPIILFIILFGPLFSTIGIRIQQASKKEFLEKGIDVLLILIATLQVITL